MLPYNKYLIKHTDRFDPASFSSVHEEVIAINAQTGHLPVLFKPEIIVSFLKDHCLQNNWMKGNPGLTALVTSGSLFTGHIELLFESCRNNPGFRQDLESYLQEGFTERPVAWNSDKAS